MAIPSLILTELYAFATDIFNAECVRLGVAKPPKLGALIAEKTPSRRRSRGGTRQGKPFISIAVFQYRPDGLYWFEEYKSFERDRDIGSVNNVTFMQYCKTLICHEVAHAIQLSIGGRVAGVVTYADAVSARQALGNVDLTTGHGDGWKMIYKSLRVQHVNSELAVRALARGDNLLPAMKKSALPVERAMTRRNDRTIIVPTRIRTSPNKYITLPIGTVVEVIAGVVSNKKGVYCTISWAGKHCRIPPYSVSVIS